MYTESVGYTPIWEWAPTDIDLSAYELAQDLDDPQSVVLSIPSGTASGTTLQVIASRYELADTAAVTVVGHSGDRIEADAGGTDLPTVALVDGATNVGQVSDLVVAFARTALLGQMTGGSGEVATFSPDEAMGFADAVSWRPETSGHDVVNATRHSISGALAETQPRPPQVPMTVPVAVWVAVGGQDIASTVVDVAADRLKLASRIFAGNRIGMVFKVVFVTESSLGPASISVEDSIQVCGMKEGDLLGHTPLPKAFGLPWINLVYVDEILGGIGYTCPGALHATATHGRIIFVSWQHGWVTTTVAHELAHAMALVDEVGHVDATTGLDQSNVMWMGETSPVPRHLFTVGQGYRMNADRESWVNSAVAIDSASDVTFAGKTVADYVKELRTAPTRSCMHQVDVADPCPPISTDVVKVARTNNQGEY
jgi:hypothetical protein